jgi:hypothetical protein
MRHLRWRRAVLALCIGASAIVAGVACSQTLSGTLSIVTGPDNGFTQNPTPTRLIVKLIGQGDASLVSQVSFPVDGGFSIPSQTGTNVDIIQVTGFDDAGTAVVSGQTLPLELDELSGITLNVFVQRTGQFSRLPEAGITTQTTAPPLLANLFSRYLLIASSIGGTTDASAAILYDTLTWQPLASQTLPLNPQSLAYINAYTGTDASLEGGATTSISALLTLNSKAALWLDLTDTTGDAAVILDADLPPSGHFVSEVAGGATVYDTTTGDTYIVGATRPKGATKTILRISQTGVLSYVSLQTARAGAAAVYLPSEGLLVFGGNPPSDGGGGYGVELLSDGKLVSDPLPQTCAPADTTTGAGAVQLGVGTQILLGGGVTPAGDSAGVRIFDFSACGTDGSAFVATWGAPPLLTSAQAFDLDANNAIVIGTTADHTIQAYQVSGPTLPDAGPTPAVLLPFREPLVNATATVLPTGSLGVVGAGTSTIESYIR